MSEEQLRNFLAYADYPADAIEKIVQDYVDDCAERDRNLNKEQE